MPVGSPGVGEKKTVLGLGAAGGWPGGGSRWRRRWRWRWRSAAVRHCKVSVVRVRAAPGIAVHEGVGRGVVLVVPGRAGDAVPVAVRVDAWDGRVVNFAGDVNPRSRLDPWSYARRVVVVLEGVDAAASLLLSVDLLCLGWRSARSERGAQDAQHGEKGERPPAPADRLRFSPIIPNVSH